MVRAGVGVTLLPDSMWQNTSSVGLSVIPVIEPILAYDIALATVKTTTKAIVPKHGMIWR